MGQIDQVISRFSHGRNDNDDGITITNRFANPLSNGLNSFCRTN
jgi:hypothetical protein